MIDGFALRAEAVIPKPGGDAHGLGLKICPFHHLLARLPRWSTQAISRGRLRNLGGGYTRSSKISRNMVTISRFQLAFISPRAGLIPVCFPSQCHDRHMGASSGGLGPEMKLAVVSGGASSVRGPVPRVNWLWFRLPEQPASEVRRTWMRIDPLHGARKLLETFWKQTFGSHNAPFSQTV